MIKQSTTYTFTFLMVLTSDHLSPATGKTVTVSLSKAGGSFGAAAGAVTEIANGWYKCAFTTADTGTLGDLSVNCTATACDPTDVRLQIALIDPIAGSIVSASGAVGSVTGAVGSVTGAVGSVTGAVGSVTGAVASVTGNVGGNVVGSVASVTAGVTVTTNNDKTGYGLSAAAVQAVWDALTSALTTAGSIGKKLADWTIGTAQTGDAYARIGAAGAGLTALGDARLANLDAAISTRSTFAGGAVASVTAGVTVATNSDKSGYALTTAPPTAVQNADALLDRTDGIETGWTLRQALRIGLSALAAKLSGAATATVVIRDVGDSKNRITATTDADGNRSAVTYDKT